MASLRDFERHVAPYVASAPVPAIEDAVLDASIELCTRARVLRRIGSGISIRAGRFEYELDPPEQDTQIVRIMAVWLAGRPLHAVTRPEVDALYPRGWVSLTTGSLAGVVTAHAPTPSTLRLVPAPAVNAPGALILDLAYAPTRTATEVPDRLLDQYAEQIADGAIARLHEQPNASYADASRAGTYRARFDTWCSKLADEAVRGGAQVRMRTPRDHFA